MADATNDQVLEAVLGPPADLHDMTLRTENGAATFRPSLWQRIRWWQRWPWRPRTVHPVDHRWDAPWITVVRQNGAIIGWHCNDVRPTGYGVKPDRWTCLFGLITGRLEFEITTMPGESVSAQYDPERKTFRRGCE